MKIRFLLCWLVFGLTTLNTMAGISIEVSPTSSTYSVGQTLYVTIRGGLTGTTYTVSALTSSTGTALSSVAITGEQNGPSVTWADGQTEASFVVRFLAGSEGDERVLQVGNGDLTETDQTGGLTIIQAPVVAISPEAVAYNIGQSVTVTVSGGVVGNEYLLQLYEGIPDQGTDLSGEITVSSSQTATNTIIWTANSSSEQFYIRFDEGSKGANRMFVVGDAELTHFGVSETFAICSGGVSTEALASDIIIPTPLGPNNCSVTVQTQAYGNSFVFTGPDNYVFSSVFRNTGTYQVSAPITKPGTYQLIVTYEDYCGKSSATKSFTVTGTACK